jgi:hypothetical protein
MTQHRETPTVLIIDFPSPVCQFLFPHALLLPDDESHLSISVRLVFELRC